jgi:hypothetical protein
MAVSNSAELAEMADEEDLASDCSVDLFADRRWFVAEMKRKFA